MSTATTLDVRPLSGALGAEIHGVDLEHLPDETFAAIRTALQDHLVLFFPDQHLTPAGHKAFGRRFGELEIHPFIPKLDDEHPEIVVLDGDRGARADVWHTDVTFSPHPPMASILHMVTSPTRGGDTMFTNQYLVYEGLSAPLRDLVDGLTAIHTASVFGHPEQQVEHPVVRVHPETHRPSLYFALPTVAPQRKRRAPRVPHRILRAASVPVPLPLEPRRCGHVGQPMHAALRRQ